MEAVLDGLPVAMMIGIVVVIGVSQLNRFAGAALSVVFWTAVLIVGLYGYGHGRALGLPGMPFPRWVFVAVCVGFAGLHSAAAWAHFRQRRRRALYDDD